METKFLYDDKPYETEFDAQVLACESCKDGYQIVLDETLFFPEQGGQSSDFGFLDSTEVVDVQILDGVISHLTKEPIEAGCHVHGKIDWQHRFSNMQQHTGEHIFTGLAHNTYGAENVGFHLSDNTVTLDLNIDLTAQQIAELELEANNVIFQNHPIKCYYPTPSELSEIEYRSKKEIEGQVRLVQIGDIDICACCAPHVRSTAEVGILKVVDFEKYKGGVRIYILCGLRAFKDYCAKQQLLNATKQVLNCTLEEIPAKSQVILDENKSVKYHYTQVQRVQLLSQIEGLPPFIPDVRLFIGFIEPKVVREGVNRLVEIHTGLCAIFSGNDEEGYSFVIGSQTRDCAAIVAGMRELLGAKGGGSKQMAQGSVKATRSEIEAII